MEDLLAQYSLDFPKLRWQELRVTSPLLTSPSSLLLETRGCSTKFQIMDTVQ